MHYFFWRKYGHLTLSKHCSKMFKEKLGNESYWHCNAHGKNKNHDYSGKHSVLRCRTVLVSNVIWSVHCLINYWVRQATPFCLMCILVYSLSNNFWNLCLISVKNAGNAQLNLIHCGQKSKNIRGQTGYSQKLFVSLYQRDRYILFLETLSCSSDMHIEKSLRLCSAGVTSTRPFITCATE